MDLDQPILNMSGKNYTKSFPEDEKEKLEPETPRNVILNALSAYPVRHRKESWVLDHIAGEIIRTKLHESFTLSEPYRSLMIESLYEALFRQDEESGKNRGIYTAHLVTAVLKLLGETEDKIK